MKIIYIVLILISVAACDEILLDKEPLNDPVTNFDNLWSEFDAKYGLFKSKNIDWDQVYEEYRPMINNNSSNAELYSVLTEMLGLLNDNHVALVPTSDSPLPFYQSGILGQLDSIDDFDLEILTNNYLQNAQFEDPFFTYGLLPNNIGYIHIEGFSDLPRFLDEPLNNILSSLNDTKAIIIDVRGGYGGEDIAGQYISGRFANITTSYMMSRIKAGPGKDDFTPFENWIVKPEGDFQYTKPVVVLTHRHTISARETFCLAMRVLPQVTFVGDTTSGAFSNQINRELPNGWGYSLSIGEWVNAQGISYEGIGIAPDIVVQNQKQDVLNGRDDALERAMEILQ